MGHDITRREALQWTAGAALGAAVASSAFADEKKPPAKSPPRSLPMRPFGKTGEKVSILGLGGGGRGRNPQIRGTQERHEERELAERIVLRALEEGVTYFDTCVGYGESEAILGHVLKDRRKELFLASKCQRPGVAGDVLKKELETSLRRLQTDRLDLWLIHNVRNRADVEQILKKGHAVDTFRWAKEQGLARLIGVSGHSSAGALGATMKACRKRGVELDALMLSFNASDRMKGGHGHALLEAHAKSHAGMVAMKVFGSDGAPLLQPPHLDAGQALRYVLSKPVSTAVIGMHTLEDVAQNARIARSFEAMPEAEIAAFERKLAKSLKPRWTLTP